VELARVEIHLADNRAVAFPAYGLQGDPEAAEEVLRLAIQVEIARPMLWFDLDAVPQFLSTVFHLCAKDAFETPRLR